MSGSSSNIHQAARRYFWRKRIIASIGVVILLVTMWISCFQGVTDIGPSRLLATLWPALSDAQPLDWSEWSVFIGIRLPRVVLGALAGAGLSVCGVVMQSITDNRMASPFTTGVSNAAAFGAALAISFGWRIGGSAQAGIIVTAFIVAGLCSVAVFGLAALTSMGKATIILTGIALSYLFSALGAALQYAANEQKLAAIVNWTFGNLGQATWPQIGTVAVILACLFAFVVINSRNFTLLLAGEESALASGVQVRRLRLSSGAMITAMAATVVSFTGVIGFVGLVGPHIASMLIGREARYHMPFSALVGAVLLVVADAVGRLVLSPVVIPVGIVVSFIGVPVFVWLIVREAKWARI